MTAQWQHFHHGADIGVRGIADDKAGAFVQAALAMSAVVADLDSIQNLESVEIACQAPDDEILLVDWLNALVYEMATRKMLFGRFELTIKGDTLRGKAWGEPVERQRHQPVVEIKGATFTELKVGQDEQGRWLAQCVVDV
ncbi:MAG: archease [Granulosicoccaceae bacterium]|jgi:tRNA nucleotidyltransferase (CCA-adding enzyme)